MSFLVREIVSGYSHWASCLFFTITLFCLVPAKGSSQEALGIVNSNYTGVNSLWINPANVANSRNSISINLLAGDLFVNSNYIFVHRKDYSFLKLFSVNTGDPKYLYIYDYPEYTFSDSVHYYDYFKNNAKKSLYINGRIAGPSISFRLGDHAFSILTAFRNNLSGDKIPYDAANFIFRGLDFYPQQDKTYDEGYFTFTMLSWIELGAGLSGNTRGTRFTRQV